MGRRKIYGDELNPRIRKMYLAGLSLNQIAQEIEAHPEVIKRKLLSMNISLRSRSEAMRNFHQKKGKK